MLFFVYFEFHDVSFNLFIKPCHKTHLRCWLAYVFSPQLARWWQWWVTDPLRERQAPPSYRITCPIKAAPFSFCVDPLACNCRTEPHHGGVAMDEVIRQMSL